MTEPKFTPGPWTVGKDYTIGPSGAGVAVITAACPEQLHAANAHLIAAAPELYEALVEIRDMLWSRPDISDRLRPLMGPGELAANQKAIAALAKARGEQ